MEIYEWILSFVLGTVTSIIGVLISIKYNKTIQNKKEEENQNTQWESLQEVMYEVRDWARELESYLKGNGKRKYKKFVSAGALYNKLACNEIPKQYRKDIFDMAMLIEEIQNGLLLETDKNEEYITSVKTLGDIACELARKPNPNFLKENKKIKEIIKK